MRHLWYWAAITVASVACLWLVALSNTRMGLI